MPMNTTASLVVRLLGPVRAWRDGVEVDIGTARRRAVFTLLALRANEAVSKDELIDGVWGDSPPASAGASLYTYISGLRQALEPGRSKRSAGVVLTSSGAGYALRLDREALDVHRFYRHRERAEALAHDDPGRAVAELDAALALWEGEALFAVPGRFAEAQRSRLHELRLATVERRAELALVLGRHTDVVAELSGLVVEHPLREGLRALLMTALHHGGRQAEALEVFRDARQVLADELGIEPGPALREAHRQVLAGEGVSHLSTTPAAGSYADGWGSPSATGPATSPSTASGATASGSAATEVAASAAAGPVPPASAVVGPATPRRSALAPFVGRRRELDLLRRAVTEVAAGRGGSLWLEGEPGIGKSALLTAGLANASAAGCLLARATADELGGRFPLRVVLDGLGVSITSSDPRRVALACDLLDPAATPDSPAAGDPVLTAIDRLLELVVELCAEAPLVLALDDFQWADEASVLLWHRLLRLTHRYPLLLIAVARPVPHRVDVARVRRAVAEGGALITLEPLAEDEVTALLTELVGAVPGDSLRRLAGCAGGNPLYVREVADALLREDAVEFRDEAAEVEVVDQDVPPSLVTALTRRLGFLSAETLELLRWAALLGTGFAPGDAAAVAGRPISELVPAVEEATAAGVLVEAGAELAFRHPVVHHALYRGTPAAVRAALHRQAAQALAVAGSPVELVARQLAAAPTAVDPWVVDWLVANAEAVAVREPDLAVAALRGVLGQPDLPAGDRERIAARLARLVFRLGHRAEADARYALARARDRELVAEVRWVLAAAHRLEGRAEEAAEVLRGAVADDGTPPVWRVRMEALSALVLTGDEAEAAARSALRRAQEVRDDFAAAHARRGLWWAATARRDHAEALRQVELALATGIGPEVHADLVGDKVFTLQQLDRLDEADGLLRTVRPHLAAVAQDYWRGRWADALDRVETHREPAPTPWPLDRGPTPPAHGVAALVAARQDLGEVALRHLRAADGRRDDFLVAAEAALAERAGRLDDALAALAGLLAPGRVGPNHQWLPTLTRLALAAGEHDLAARAVEAAVAEAGPAWADAEARPAGTRAAAGTGAWGWPAGAGAESERAGTSTEAWAAKVTAATRPTGTEAEAGSAGTGSADGLSGASGQAKASTAAGFAGTGAESGRAGTGARAWTVEVTAAAGRAGAVAAAWRCRGLVDHDPAPVLEAAAWYRAVGRPVELAEALEDAAALLAGSGDGSAADAVVREAVAVYRGFGAEWDARRAGVRLRRVA